MMIRTESRRTIAGSVDEVWEYLSDVGRWAEWAPTVLQCWIRGGGALEPGAWVEQRAKDLGWTHHRTEAVTAVEAPRHMEFAGTMGTSPSRWAFEVERAGDRKTDVTMWVEVDLAGVMRAIPGPLRGSLQRVGDREMAAVKAAVESAARQGAHG